MHVSYLCPEKQDSVGADVQYSTANKKQGDNEKAQAGWHILNCAAVIPKFV